MRNNLYCIFSVLAIVLIVTTCKPRQREEMPGATRPAGEPVTLEMLSWMPESAVSAIAIPSVERAYEQIETILLRGAPEGIDMQAELKVIVSQAARKAGVYDASTVADIAFAKGVDPEEPLAIYFAGASAEHVNQPVQDELLRTLGFDAVPPFVAAFPVADRRDAEKFVAGWGGTETMESLDLDMPQTTVFTRPDKLFSYFFTSTHLVAGTSPELVRGVAERMKTPSQVRYGTPACPADSAFELVQLVRTDKLAGDSEVSGVFLPRYIRNAFPRAVRDAAADAWAGWLADYTGVDPMVVTWTLNDDSATLRARLDYGQHPAAKQRLGDPAPLKHISLIPTDALGVYSIEVTPRMREGFKELTTQFVGNGGGLVAQINEAFGQLIDTAGDEATIAVFDTKNATNMAMLVEFTDGDVTRAKMKELGLAPIVAETYNNIEIYSLILPAPVPVYYALARNTLIAANSVDQIKTLIDSVMSGKSTGFAAALEPPLDPEAPRTQLLVARQDLLTKALLPVLTEANRLDETQSAMVARGVEKIREVRLHTDIRNNWQDTRLVVQLD